MQETQNIYERRLVDRMRVFWDNLRDSEDVPLSAKFNGRALQDIWDSCLGVKVTASEGKNLYQCYYEGEKLKKALNKDLKFKYFSSLETGGIVSRAFIASLDEAVIDRKIIISQGQFVTDKGKILKYRDCILPFKKQDETINMLIIGISWKVF